MRVLLTGATGFIGQHVLARLVARGEDVRVLALPETIGEIAPTRHVEIVSGSLLDPAVVARAARNVDVVLHLAAKVSGPPLRDFRAINVGGTENLLRASIAARVSRFVYVSSTAVYGLSPFPVMWPLREDSPLAAHGGRGLRLYGASKIEAENAVRRACELDGLEYVILRPTMTYGRGATGAERLLLSLLPVPPVMWLEIAPRAVVQWLHVNDLVDALMRAMTYRSAANEAFNVAGPRGVTLAELAAALRTAIGSPWRIPLPFFRPSSMALVPPFDIGKAARLLGFAPKIAIPEGLIEMFDRTATERPPQRDGARGGPA